MAKAESASKGKGKKPSRKPAAKRPAVVKKKPVAGKKAARRVVNKAATTKTVSAKTKKPSATRRAASKPAARAKRKAVAAVSKTAKRAVPRRDSEPVPLHIDTSLAAAVAARAVATPAVARARDEALRVPGMVRGSSAFRHLKEGLAPTPSQQVAKLFGPLGSNRPAVFSGGGRALDAGGKRTRVPGADHLGHFGVPRRAAG